MDPYFDPNMIEDKAPESNPEDFAVTTENEKWLIRKIVEWFIGG